MKLLCLKNSKYSGLLVPHYIYLHHVAIVLHVFSLWQYVLLLKYQVSSHNASTVFKPLTVNWKSKLDAYLEIELKV